MVKPKSLFENLRIYILLIITVVIFVIGRIPDSSFLRNPMSFVFQPIAYVAMQWGGNISKWSNALINASKYIDGYDQCKKEIAELKSLEQATNLVITENEVLKKQLKLSNIESEYAMGNVVKYLPDGSLMINVGTEDLVKGGDVVAVGNIFVGTVISSDLNSSIVKLPINKSSNYEVSVFPADIDISNPLKQDVIIKSSGVVSGGVDGIRIGNININSDVTDGDLVVIRDERIGELLILGRVVGIESNPASTSKSGFVSPIYDYANLITVFVKTN